jgi:predicted methyltransferase
MTTPLRTPALLLAVLLAAFAGPAAAADVAERTTEKLRAAMAAPDRPAADVERDANRKPVETLAFFGLTDEMTVLELVPGGGWYTRLLAPTLAERGRLYVSVGTGRVEETLLGQPGFEAVEVLPFDAIGERTDRRFEVEPFAFGVNDVDLVLTFRNLHNFTETGRASLNRAAFEALVPGGLYGVVDHTRRHMEYDHYEVWRRMDPVRMIREIEAAGFEFVDYSDLHYRPDDELRYEVGRASVTGNTDRFTLLFRKPD